MKMLKTTLIISILGIMLSFISLILGILGCMWTDAIATSATIISIVLAFVSIIYTYKSGEETLNTLIDIREENKCLVNQITKDMCNDNFDDINLESLNN